MIKSFSEDELVDVGEVRPDENANFSINPDVRLKYYQSLGKVKKVQVQGKSFIKDSDENIGKRNSFDGYEMFLIPAKDIAAVDKFYEVTRDLNGTVRYMVNPEGCKIPSLESQTYFMPIDMARDFYDAQNKSEMVQNPFVEKSYHTINWELDAGTKIRRLTREMEHARENDGMERTR